MPTETTAELRLVKLLVLADTTSSITIQGNQMKKKPKRRELKRQKSERKKL